MKFRVTVAYVWWVEAETLAHAQGEAMREAGALAASLGWAVEARLYAEDPAKGFLPSVGRLEHLVSDLLDLSRLEAGMAPLTTAVVNLREIADDAVDECQAANPTARITIAAPDAILLTADPGRLHQVLSNLLANAIAHGDGPIAVTASASGTQLTLTIADHGRGRGLDGDTDRWFERFYRADNSSTGTGLGLAIVRWIVDLHGGTVRAETNQPTGARFIVTLPTT